MTDAEFAGDTGSRVVMLPATRRDGEAAARALAGVGLVLEVVDAPGEIAGEIVRGVGALVLTEIALAGPGFGKLVEALDRQPEWSDIPIVLTLRGDAPAAITRMIERLSNVTVVDRPTSVRTLVSSIQAALRARRRQYEIRDRIAALERAEQALLDADSRKDRFLATLAHELRNPLAPIRNAAFMLTAMPLTRERLASCADMIARQTRSMARLLDDLVDVARITSGKLALKVVEVRLQPVVDAAVEAVRPLVEAKRQHLRVTVRDAAAPLRADPLRLTQVLTNVLTNAAKYTDAGGHVALEAGIADGSVEFVVSDDGVGIDPDVLPGLFEMFTQAETTLDRSQGGLGIGLSLSRSLIEMHGGRISASSAGRGRGSVFRISLPRSEGAADDAAPDALPPIPGPGDTAGRRVLVADDNEDAANSMAMLLEGDGYRVETARDGLQAIARARANPPDAMVVDIGMPGADGYEVARRVRDEPWGGRVVLIATTGWGQPEDRRRAFDAGFDAHFTKPVLPDHVRSLLADRLRAAAR